MKLDAERFRALEASSAYGITLRPNGHHGMLLYIHDILGSQCDWATGKTLGECVDQYVREQARKRRDVMVTLPDR
jgi:hypothetical protein